MSIHKIYSLVVIVFCCLQLQAKELFVKKHFDIVNNLVVKNFLAEEILQISTPYSLQLLYQNVSASASHFTYQLLHNATPVFAQKIKINITSNGNVISVSNNVMDLLHISSNAFEEATLFLESKKYVEQMQEIMAPSFDDYKIIEKQNYFFVNDEHLLPAMLLRVHKPGLDSSYLINLENKKTLLAFNNARNLTDTIVRMKVFMPDPLTRAKQMYGGVFINNLDANAAWLDAAQVDTIAKARFDSSSNLFVLENAFAKIIDVNPPLAFAATQANANFYFTRTQSGFEDCNAFFHVSNFKTRINNLGFPGLLDLQLRIDAHGHNGADNSTFYSLNPPLLDLGTGGVNDAEDADVIIHEYAHGVSWSANNNFISTTERAALDEGLADYFATSYSRSIDTFQWQNIFNWDGHNEFWSGRTAITSLNYSLPFSQNIYSGGSIFNNAMSLIWTELGAEITDKLMLQSLYFYTDSTTFWQAANYILQADTLFYNGVHTAIICNRFWQKNIFASQCAPLSVQDILTDNTVFVANQIGFAQATESLLIHYPKTENTIEIQLKNIAGQTVLNKKLFRNASNYFELQPLQNLPNGMYFLQINNVGQGFKIPINRK